MVDRFEFPDFNFILSYCQEHFLGILAFLFISALVIRIFFVPFLRIIRWTINKVFDLLFGPGDRKRFPKILKRY